MGHSPLDPKKTDVSYSDTHLDIYLIWGHGEVTRIRIHMQRICVHKFDTLMCYQLSHLEFWPELCHWNDIIAAEG